MHERPPLVRKRIERLFREATLDRDPSFASRGIKDYERELPEFRGQTIIEHLQERIKAEDEVSILDVGCGQARFLCDLLKRFPQLKTYGLSAFDYRRRIFNPRRRWLLKKVDYRIGDAHELQRIFSEKLDFITSVSAFAYFGDPLDVLRQCYSLLKRGGAAFIDQPCFDVSKDEMKLLEVYWKRQGIEVELTHHPLSGVFSPKLAVEKSEVDELPLPFRYKVSEDGGLLILTYELDYERLKGWQD